MASSEDGRVRPNCTGKGLPDGEVGNSQNDFEKLISPTATTEAVANHALMVLVPSFLEILLWSLLSDRFQSISHLTIYAFLLLGREKLLGYLFFTAGGGRLRVGSALVVVAPQPRPNSLQGEDS